MLGNTSRAPTMGRIRRAGAVALVLSAGMPGMAAIVAAQQAPSQAPAKPPAKKATPPPVAAAQGGSKNSWVKLCEKTPLGAMYKDGKEEMRYATYCLTQHERIDGNTGRSVVTAAIREMDGESKQYFMVMVPLGMLLKPGMRAALYPKDLWEKVQKNESVDESKLKGLKLEYTLCHGGGCTAEAETTPELINDLKTFGGMVIFAINSGGNATPFPIAFAGFEQAYTGNPADPQQYAAGRRALMQMIAQRRQELADQQKKQAQQAPAASAPAPASPPPAKK
jgi:invasion protein IalB